MGFFSFITQDTNKSVANAHSNRPTFTVYLMDDKGKLWVEDNYEGYGVFGGKDYYELLAEMNGKTTRDEGITLAFGKEPFIAPNLVEDPSRLYSKDAPKDCPSQGYFYDDEEEEEFRSQKDEAEERIEDLIHDTYTNIAVDLSDRIEFEEFIQRVLPRYDSHKMVDSQQEIYQLIDERRGFDYEIIGYHNAINYIKENDPSMMRCFELAQEYMYNTRELNSETLASMLSTEISRDEFNAQKNLFAEINTLTLIYLNKNRKDV